MLVKKTNKKEHFSLSTRCLHSILLYSENHALLMFLMIQIK